MSQFHLTKLIPRFVFKCLNRRLLNAGYVLIPGMAYDRAHPSLYQSEFWRRMGNNERFEHYDYVRFRALELVADEIYAGKVPGNVAEAGVAHGDFAQIINYKFPDRTLYLFDTFEGFDPEEKKHEIEQGYSTGAFFDRTGDFRDVEGPDFVLKRLPHPEKAVIRKGLFPKTAEGLEDRFAFVSLDMDLYLPILNGLKYFYPRLSDRGYLFLHD
jgi:O-methyltransferase